MLAGASPGGIAYPFAAVWTSGAILLHYAVNTE